MSFLRRIGAGLLMRRVLRSLEGIETGLREQNRLLARIADHLAPELIEAEPQTTAQAGVDFLNPIEAVLVDGFISRTQTEQGRPPTEDEILRYLADEETLLLQQRMMAEDTRR